VFILDSGLLQRSYRLRRFLPAGRAQVLHHRDPFDRMLIGQAKHEHMSVITVDQQFNAYEVDLVRL